MIVLNEHRTSPRKILKVKARVAVEGAAPLTARTLDIGAGGMSLAAPDPLKPGATAQVNFDLFFEGKVIPIQARSKVTYCILSNGEFKAGLQFLNLDLSGMTTLARYLR